PHAPPSESYTLSLHDALPIWKIRGPAGWSIARQQRGEQDQGDRFQQGRWAQIKGNRPAKGLFVDHLNQKDRQQEARADPQNDARDRKSTRLNSSHVAISYAVF